MWKYFTRGQKSANYNPAAGPACGHLVHSQKVGDLLYNQMFDLSLVITVVQFGRVSPFQKDRVEGIRGPCGV